MNYRINEIFYSIQGEGYWTGMPAIFIRFAGCNLKCPWCDTDHAHYEFMYIEQILKELEKYPCKNIILTGGEPALQVDKSLLLQLTVKYKIHIETNGTVNLDLLSPFIHWITVSPKEPYELLAQKRGHELKVVYEGQDLRKYDNLNFLSRYLQPLSNENIQETIEKVKEDPRWSLSLQTHKWTNIR